jgi:hypothetical protein
MFEAEISWNESLILMYQSCVNGSGRALSTGLPSWDADASVVSFPAEVTSSID